MVKAEIKLRKKIYEFKYEIYEEKMPVYEEKIPVYTASTGMGLKKRYSADIEFFARDGKNVFHKCTYDFGGYYDLEKWKFLKELATKIIELEGKD